MNYIGPFFANDRRRLSAFKGFFRYFDTFTFNDDLDRQLDAAVAMGDLR